MTQYEMDKEKLLEIIDKLADRISIVYDTITKMAQIFHIQKEMNEDICKRLKILEKLYQQALS